MTAPEESLQDRLYRLGARSLTKLLTLQDRNPHSPTYGCFDRKFWHLRVTDFPSGMAQEFVLPLAIAYAHPFRGNSFFGEPSIKEWVRAGIHYAAKASHRDGSCDDYYPYERAAGAAAFSLYAALEAIGLAKLDPAPFLPFLELRGRWLATHQESGRLSNHEALIANCLFRLARLTGKENFRTAANSRLQRLLGWQDPEEGWFYEYQGADPGYLTLTIANLAEIETLEGLNLRKEISAAVRFLHELQPPDGWLGGEWTSRNTNNYFPHGLELCGRWLPEALQINDRAIEALEFAPDYDDDNILAHHSWSYLKAALHWNDARPEPSTTKPRHFPHAGMLILQEGPYTLLVALKKGGAVRLYRDAALVYADTGVSLLVEERRKIRNLVCHLWSEKNEIQILSNAISISGPMGYAKHRQMTPAKNVILRLLMMTCGRFNSDLVRRLLQKLLITGEAASPVTFDRSLTLNRDGLIVEDTLRGSGKVISAGVGPAQTSIYTVMSRVFHRSQLQPWADLTSHIRPGSDPLFHAVRKIG